MGIKLSAAHIQKRKEQSGFSLRLDIFGSYLQHEMTYEDYKAFTFAFPEEADKIILDGMYDGDFYSVYESKIIPRRQGRLFKKFRDNNVDIFKEFVDHIHKNQKQCWITARISEVQCDVDENPFYAYEEHPDWFISAFGYWMQNMSVKALREHKLKVLEEVMRKYPFDGLDIDFERHTPVLPPGRQWELRECITDYMRQLRRITLQIGQEQNRVVLLSARVPDCLKGCHMDGLDIETWLEEDLVDCLTLGSRSFDLKIEEFKNLSGEVAIYGCYDPHHTVDGYCLPPLALLHGVAYSWLCRGADGVEYFNWMGEGKKAMVEYYLKKYNADRIRDGFALFSKDEFQGLDDMAYLKNKEKHYVIDRKGGYPWGIGYGNLNADRQLPAQIQDEGTVVLYLPENTSWAKKVTFRLVFEELAEIPEVSLNGKRIEVAAAPIRDLQITTEKRAPNSGTGVSNRLLSRIDMSKPCTLLSADLTGVDTCVGYNEIKVRANGEVSLEKVELIVEPV